MRAQLAAVVLVSSALFAGCSSKNHASGAAGEAASIREVGVAEVATFVRDKSATIVDANGTDTRKEFGVIPGAVLLTSSKDYPVDVLPSAKASKLVFYCGGVMCRASDKAASRAAAAGYTDVSVLRDGIKGWKNAGQPTEMPRS
jgi:rhodanese-related sulfurtransferase